MQAEQESQEMMSEFQINLTQHQYNSDQYIQPQMYEYTTQMHRSANMSSYLVVELSYLKCAESCNIFNVVSVDGPIDTPAQILKNEALSLHKTYEKKVSRIVGSAHPIIQCGTKKATKCFIIS